MVAKTDRTRRPDWIWATSTPTSCASSRHPKRRGLGGGQAAHHPGGFEEALLLRAAAARGHRGRNPLALGRLLEELGHEVLVANSRKTRLIYANKRKTDEIDALRTSLAWQGWIQSSCIR
jgi:hypothetical protein